MAKFDEWLGLFAEECRYQVMPRENYDRGLPAALIFCDSRAMLEDRIRALREANKYNIHTDRHVIGLPRVFDDGSRSRRRSRSTRPIRKARPGCSRPASIATGSKRGGSGLQDPRQADPARHLRRPQPARDAVMMGRLMRASSYAPLDDALELLAGYGIELDNGNSNHAPMVAEALCALGRPEAVVPWIARYRERMLPRPPAGSTIRREDLA